MAATLLASTLAAPAAAAERSFPVSAFNEVVADSAVEVRVRTDAAPSARAEGDAAAIGRLDVHVEGNRLVVRTLRGVRWPHGPARAVVYVTVPALRAGKVSGSGDLRIDRVAGPGFSGAAGGSGNLFIGELRTAAATLSSSGSGNIFASGAVEQLDATVSGSGNINVRGVRARDARVSASGSGNVQAWASGEAEVLSSGSGNATVTGGARCRVHAGGSGEAKCG